MKNWDVTLAQSPLVVVQAYYIYQAVVYCQQRTRDPSLGGTESAFVFLISIGIVLLGMALGLQEIRNYRARKEVRKE